jgi:hypothetical protein
VLALRARLGFGHGWFFSRCRRSRLSGSLSDNGLFPPLLALRAQQEPQRQRALPPLLALRAQQEPQRQQALPPVQVLRAQREPRPQQALRQVQALRAQRELQPRLVLPPVQVLRAQREPGHNGLFSRSRRGRLSGSFGHNGLFQPVQVLRAQPLAGSPQQALAPGSQFTNHQVPPPAAASKNKIKTAILPASLLSNPHFVSCGRRLGLGRLKDCHFALLRALTQGFGRGARHTASRSSMSCGTSGSA